MSAPTSYSQHGIWVTEQTGRAGTAYRMPLGIWLEGELDEEAIADACRDVVARHDVLRSAFEERDGTLHMRAATREPPIVVTDFSDRLLDDELARDMDLRHGPLTRFVLARAAPGRYLLLVVAHHLVFDGMSKDVLVRDLAACYGARFGGERLVPLSTTYADQVRVGRAQVDAELPAARDFWNRRWEEPSGVVLPGLSRTPMTAERGAVLDVDFDAPMRTAVEQTSDALGVTRFELLLASVHALLYRYGNANPVVAVDLSTRAPAASDHIGLFVNELPVFAPDLDAATFREFVGKVRTELRQVYRFRAVPLTHAVGGLRPRAAMAPVSLSYRRRADDLTWPGLHATVDWVLFNRSARNALHIQVVESSATIAMSLQYSPDAISEDAVARVAEHLRMVVAGVVTDPDLPVRQLPVLPPRERSQVLAWSDATSGCDAAPEALARALRLFEEQVATGPDAAAVVSDEDVVTYAQLDRRASRVAAALSRELDAGSVVAVCLERSTELLAVLLGVWKAGGAFLPLDPDDPRDRLAHVVHDSGATLLVSSERLLDRLPKGIRAICVDGDLHLDEDDEPDHEAHDGMAERPTNVAGDLEAGSLAYVLYTSGSTGRPKGVAVHHAALANLLRAMRDVMRSRPTDRWLVLTALSFDISLVEIFLPLTTGGCAVIGPAAGARDTSQVLAAIRRHDVTHVQATPSGWRLLLAGGFRERGATGLVGGEELPQPLARMLRSRLARLVHAYGPTETTVISTWWEVPQNADDISIGRPIDNTHVYVLDETLEPVPIGVPGEVFISGVGVARGYLGRPAPTAARFVPDPFVAPGQPGGARMYSTGDRALWRTDGALQFLGRRDDQVKVRGHRIELGEIEVQLAAHPNVAQAVAVVRPDAAGEPALVAYLVVSGPPPTHDEARSFLLQKLPAYMVPASFVILDRLPLTSSGKVARNALPDPPLVASGAGARRRHDNAATAELEEQVANIFCEVLGIGDLGPDQDLFDLGGHSLSVTQMAARIRTRVGVDVPLKAFFAAPTVTGVVGWITQSRRAGSSDD